jgi:GT2 family glycosyltransferase
VSVVVPFLGDAEEASALLAVLKRIELGPGDELIIADNTPDRIVAPIAGEPIEVVEAGDRRSASYARNAGAAAAGGEWLLFCDADCVPPADLLDAYFSQPPDERCAVVAGEVEGLDEQGAFLARWARSRRGRWVGHHLSRGPYPAGVTANLMVRRAAFEELGGFRIGGGGDLDLCWRAQGAGWGFVYRADVVVRHRDRERLSELVDQAIAYGGHQRRLRDLYGSVVAREPLLVPVARSLGAALAWTARGRLEQARFKLLDGCWACLQRWGWLTRGGRARRAD